MGKFRALWLLGITLFGISSSSVFGENKLNPPIFDQSFIQNHLPKISPEARDPLAGIDPILRSILAEVSSQFMTVDAESKAKIQSFWAEVRLLFSDAITLEAAFYNYSAVNLPNVQLNGDESIVELANANGKMYPIRLTLRNAIHSTLPPSMRATFRKKISPEVAKTLVKLAERREAAYQESFAQLVQVLDRENQLLERFSRSPRFAFLKQLRDCATLSRDPHEQFERINDVAALFYGLRMTGNLESIKDEFFPWFFLSLIPAEGSDLRELLKDDFKTIAESFGEKVQTYLALSPKNVAENLQFYSNAMQLKPTNPYESYQPLPLRDLPILYTKEEGDIAKESKQSLNVRPYLVRNALHASPEFALLSPSAAQKDVIADSLVVSSTRIHGQHTRIALIDIGLNPQELSHLKSSLVPSSLDSFGSYDIAGQDTNPFIGVKNEARGAEFNHGTLVAQGLEKTLAKVAPHALNDRKFQLSFWNVGTLNALVPGNAGDLPITSALGEIILRLRNNAVGYPHKAPVAVGVSLVNPKNASTRKYVNAILSARGLGEEEGLMRTSNLWIMGAGNNGVMTQDAPISPCFLEFGKYRPSERILCVGSVRKSEWNGKTFHYISDYSNYGDTDIYTVEEQGSNGEEGTSLAQPVILGVVAALADRYPSLSAEQLRAAVLKAARPQTLQHFEPVFQENSDEDAKEKANLKIPGIFSESGIVDSFTIQGALRRIQKNRQNKQNSVKTQTGLRSHDINATVFDVSRDMPEALRIAGELDAQNTKQLKVVQLSRNN